MQATTSFAGERESSDDAPEDTKNGPKQCLVAHGVRTRSRERVIALLVPGHRNDRHL
jgi:hypothetical protein